MIPTASSCALASLLLLSACEPGRGEVREWQAADHDAPDRPKAQQPVPTVDKDASDALATTVWRKTCASCHGPQGRGDGPQGAMVGAPDLTREEWLAQAADEEIARVIREGKNRMPANPDLPDNVLRALVKRIRARGKP